jgi:methionine-gamma-lyase
MREALQEGDRAERLRMIHVETPSNPTNDLVDIRACAGVARELSTKDRRVILAVDNTFLGPVFQHPLKHGADLVIYSLTKYVGGHSDLIAGAVLGAPDLMEPIRATRTFLGNMAGPFTGFLLMRSLETLKIRMHAEMENAVKLADFLRDHPKVARVSYLGHLKEGDEGHDVYRRQCTGPGSMIAFEVKGGEEEAFRFLNALKLIKLAVSLGGTESLAEHPGAMTHSDIPLDDQEKIGITPAMCRISVGLEDPDDLMADVAQALDEV